MAGNFSFFACVPIFPSILKEPSFLSSSFVLGRLVFMYLQSSQASSPSLNAGVLCLLQLY